MPPCANQCADTATQDKMDFFKTVETNRGRGETRRYYQSTDIEWFQDKPLWKNLTSIGIVESLRKVKGKTSIERCYFLSSLPLNAQHFAKAVRGHLGIENALHWSLDVTFQEDDSRARTKNAAQNVASLRRIAINLIKKDRTQNCYQRSKRFLASIDPKFLNHLLGI